MNQREVGGVEAVPHHHRRLATGVLSVCLGALLASVALLAGCNSERTLEQSLSQRDQFRTTMAALRATGLDKRITEQDGYVTLLAPSDEAWEATFSAEELERLFEPPQRESLRELMELHVVPGWHTLSQLAEQRQARTFRGEALAVTAVAGRVRIREASVVSADMAAKNGVIHALDRVLEPRAPREIPEVVLERADALGRFSEALELTGLNERLREPGPFTVFVPDDAAFERLEAPSWEELTAPGNLPLLEAVVLQHIVPEQLGEAELEEEPQLTTLAGTTLPARVTQAETLRVGEASIVATGVEATNGLVHIVDTVLVPEVLPEPETRIYAEMSVAETLGELDEVRRFARAVELAEWSELLEAEELTVFAVHDDVLDRLPEGNLLREVTEEGAPAQLRGRRQEQLRDLLAYYLVPGTRSTASLREAQGVATRHDGAMLTVLAEGRQTRVDGVLVSRPNVVSRNGMVHVLDGVLEPVEPPPGTPAMGEVLAAAGVFEVLLGLFEAAGMSELLEAEAGPQTLLAPPDEAFAPYIGIAEPDEGAIEQWIATMEPEEIAAILQRHLLAGWVREEWLQDSVELGAASGEWLTVERPEADTLRIVVGEAEASIEESDTVANGIIHTLDSPLLVAPASPFEEDEAQD